MSYLNAPQGASDSHPRRGWLWLWIVWLCAMAPLAGVAGGCAGDELEAPNQPPVLTLSVGATARYTVGELVRIEASAEDPDGDALTFEVVGLPERAQLQTFANSAVMTWDPIASDVTGAEPLRLVFVAADARGARAERVVNLSIAAGNALPEFTSASSKLFDPSGGQTLKFEVKVRADASNQVVLTMPADTAPEGAQLVQTGPKTAEFTWKPTAAQQEQRVHSAIFVADDDKSAPVEQKFTIILQKMATGGGNGPQDPGQGPSTGASCSQARPITHGSPGPQRTDGDYELRAYLSADAAQRYDLGYILWALDDPMSYEVDFEIVEMKVGAGLMRGGIPNLPLTGNESQTVYYTICAANSSADVNDPDGFVCAPYDYYYSFTAYAPGSARCADDGRAGGGFGDAATVSDTRWEEFQSCPGSADFHKVTASPGESVEVFVLHSFTETPQKNEPYRSLEITVYDQNRSPIRDLVIESDCEGIAYLLLEAPAQSAKTWYLEVKSARGAEVPYQVTAFRSGDSNPPVETCTDNDRFGNNHTLNNAAELTDGTYRGLTVCAGTPDWYYGLLLEDEQFLVELTVQDGPPLHQVTLQVFDPDYDENEALDEGRIDQQNLYIEFTAPWSGFFYIKVSSPVDMKYTLDFLSE